MSLSEMPIYGSIEKVFGELFFGYGKSNIDTVSSHYYIFHF